MGKRIKALLISMAVLLVAMVSLASCGKRTYSVTFKSGTETVAVAETDKEGRVYPAYAECAEGVRFVGWYESEESTTPFDFEKEITSDKTLYARFASLTYEVKYDAGCEGLKAPVQESVNHDGTFTVKVEYISCGSLEGKTMLLVDPMLATGSSAALVYEALVEKGGMPAHTHVASIIGSEQGVDYVQRHMPHATTSLWCAAVDEELTSRSYIVPGIGDAGDLAYGEKL